jgi:hypothetical protein
MPPRKAVPQRTLKVAALRTLAESLRVERDGQLVPALSHEQAKKMTEADIEAMFEYDHNIHHAIGGACQHWNLTPRLKAEHRAKTAKKDVPMIAKAKRVEASHAEFRRKMLSKTGEETAETDKKPSRKMQSRGFQQWRNFKGEIVKRGKP